MNKQKIKAVIQILETTLGTMPSRDADNVVRGVIAMLRAEVCGNRKVAETKISMNEQYQCQSYVDDNGVLQDCTCGKCFEK